MARRAGRVRDDKLVFRLAQVLKHLRPDVDPLTFTPQARLFVDSVGDRAALTADDVVTGILEAWPKIDLSKVTMIAAWRQAEQLPDLPAYNAHGLGVTNNIIRLAHALHLTSNGQDWFISTEWASLLLDVSERTVGVWLRRMADDPACPIVRAAKSTNSTATVYQWDEIVAERCVSGW